MTDNKALVFDLTEGFWISEGGEDLYSNLASPLAN